MKYNLSKKLFVVTLALLLMLMGGTLLFQVLFFEDFYEERKVNSLTKSIERFSSLYSYQLNSDTTRATAMYAFENNNNAKIVIFSYDNGSFSPLYITNFNNNNDKDEMQTLTSYCRELSEDSNLITNVMKNNKTESSIFYNRSSSTKRIGVITPISLNSKNDGFVIAVSSIQPIEEAAGVIGEFYIYIFIAFIFISIILSSIYSNFISKPLVRLNAVATKMSNLDFSESCVTTRNDEVGNLAKTLNFLSSNLNDALEDLKQKNKQLELDIEKERSLDAMRKDFIASVSHELKTPIGIIEGYAEGIKDGIVSREDAIAYLDTIIDESKKMGILVSNMLELSKLESGATKPNMEYFNINRLINKVVTTQLINAEERNLNLTFTPHTEYSYVNADTFQMEQVMTNLITNAIKYTPSGNNIKVSIDIEGEEYRISVINEGASIDEEELPKIFDKFYRVDKSRQRNTNSTGLGLSIVKNLLELHNFRYIFHNIDTGVEFVFYIPIAKEELLYE